MSQQINLFNPIFLKQRKIFSAHTMLQALVIVFLGLCGLAGFGAWQVERLKREVALIEARFKAEEARLAEARAALTARKPTAELEQRAKRLEEEVALREAVLRLVETKLVGDPTGAGVYLRALARQHLEGLWLTAVEFDGADMSLAGRTLSADLLPEYLRRLGREEVLRGRQFATLRMQRPQTNETETPHYIEFVLQSRPAREAQ